MDLTEDSFVPHWAYIATAAVYFLVGMHLTITTSLHALVMFIWSIWALGLGYNKQEKYRADVIKEG